MDTQWTLNKLKRYYYYDIDILIWVKERPASLKSKRIDIKILLSRIRADEKKEQVESNVFFGLIAVAVIVTGVIVSL